jgi:hypothetical protein
VLPSNANATLTQSFQAAAAAVEALTPKPGTVLHVTKRLQP